MTSTSNSIGRGLAQLFQHMPRRRRWQALGILCFMFVGAFAELMTLGAVIPFLALIGDPQAASSYPMLGRLFAAVGWNDPTRILVPAAILFSLIAVMAGAIRIALLWVSQKFVFRLGHDLSSAVYEVTLYQPYSFHVLQNSSDLIAGINKVQQVIFNVMLPLMLAVISLTIGLFIFGALLVVDVGVAIIAALSFGTIYVAVGLATKKRLKKNSSVIARSQTERVQTVQEGLGGIRDVLIDHAQPVYLAKFKHADSALRDAQAANALIGATPRFVVESTGMVLIAVLALMLSAREGGIAGALPVLGALALGAQRLLPLLQQVYYGWSQIMGNRQLLFDILRLLGKGRGHLGESARAAPLPFKKAITVNHVSFRYSAEAPCVLTNVSFEIPNGARVAFIGKTGSGKSTIMDLLMGLLDPSEGDIRVDGEPIMHRRAEWQAQIAHVPQSIYLSDTTIAENIAFGIDRGAIDMERVAQAALQADVHEFIETLPQGYDTFVGERGIRLSGGQRQRIGIARALYKEAKVLVFDEATSALDDATEAAVMASINALGKDLTVLMIAHRLSTVRACDHVYHLSDGEIINRGTFEEVVGAGQHSAAASG